VVPERRLADFPALVRPPGVRGAVALDLGVQGTLEKPSATLRAAARGLAVNAASSMEPIDLDVDGHYDGETGDVQLRGAAGHDARLDASTHVAWKTRDVLNGGLAPWTASARARLDRFPLRGVAALAGIPMTGIVSGEMSLEGLHENAVLHARIDA